MLRSIGMIILGSIGTVISIWNLGSGLIWMAMFIVSLFEAISGILIYEEVIEWRNTHR